MIEGTDSRNGRRVATEVGRSPARRAPERAAGSAVERRILTAAERLLATGTPFTALSMRRIADAAGLARSTVYRYFPQKNCLLIRLVDADTQNRFAPAERWWEHWRAGDPDALTDALAAMLVYRRDRGHLLDALAEVAAYDSAVARYHVERAAYLFERVVETVRRSRLDTGVTSAAAERTAALIIAATVERTAELYCALYPPVEPRRIAAALSAAVAAVSVG